MKTVLLLCVLLLSVSKLAVAQTAPVDTANGKLYYILLKDGSHIQGRIVKRDSTMYTVRMKNGQLTYVEKELFSQISGFEPVMADSAAYFSQSTYGRANTTQPNQQTVSPGKYIVTLTDGTTLNGQVLSQDSSRVVLKTTTIGTVYVPAERVLRMERMTADGRRVGSGSGGAYPNIFPQYLNFTPTAYQAERGRLYYRNTLVYFNQLDVGITNNWSVGVGCSLLPNVLFGWVTTKLSVPVGDRARIGVQGQHFFGAGSSSIVDNSFRASYLQGIVSLGDSQKNLTIGLGVNIGQNSEGQILTVGYVKKLSAQVTFISENQLVLNTGSYITLGKLGAGIRFDRQRHSFDLSVNVPILISSYRVLSGFSAGVIPLGSYQLRIGK